MVNFTRQAALFLGKTLNKRLHSPQSWSVLWK